jgi:Tol biopolymer transport system component
MLHRAASTLIMLAPCSAAMAQDSMGAMSHGNGAVMYHAPQWSPDGQWIVVSANVGGDTEIFLVRPDGSARRQLTTNTVADELARWSEDGRRIRFQSDRTGKTASFTMNVDGTDVRPASRDSVISRSPDGAILLFETVRDGRGRLYTMSAARTDAREIRTARHAEQGSFSPDGRTIVFEQRDSMHEGIRESEIIVARPDGSDPRVVSKGTDPQWSRDGKLILFKIWDSATQHLWISIVAPDGSGFRRLAPGVHPSWSPDNSQIAFMSDRKDGGADIWIINRDGKHARCITCKAPFR